LSADTAQQFFLETKINLFNDSMAFAMMLVLDLRLDYDTKLRGYTGKNVIIRYLPCCD